MIKPKAILLDLDDTIISFDGVAEIAWKRCSKQFIEENQVDFTYEVLMKKLFDTRKWYWGDPERHKRGRENLVKSRREVVRYTLKALGFNNEERSNAYADNYTRMQNEMIYLFPDSIEAIETFRSMGIRLGLVTNGTSKGQREKLKRFNIEKYFELILIDTEVGISKPDPGIFKLALDRLELKSDQVWMAGDNLIWDIQGPKKLGIYTLWNDFRKRGLSADSKVVPDRIIHSLRDISDILIKEC